MARAIWTGSINFGLVSIPVGIYSDAASSGSQRQAPAIAPIEGLINNAPH